MRCTSDGWKPAGSAGGGRKMQAMLEGGARGRSVVRRLRVSGGPRAERAPKGCILISRPTGRVHGTLRAKERGQKAGCSAPHRRDGRREPRCGISLGACGARRYLHGRPKREGLPLIRKTWLHCRLDYIALRRCRTLLADCFERRARDRLATRSRRLCGCVGASSRAFSHAHLRYRGEGTPLET